MSLRERWNNPKDLGDLSRFPECRKRGEIVTTLVTRYAPDKQGAIIDFGCGCGRDLYELYVRGYRNLTGLEINGGALTVMSKAYPMLKDIELRIDELERFSEPPNRYDLGYTFTTLQHIEPKNIGKVARAISIACRYLVLIENERSTSVNYLWIHDYESMFADCELLEMQRVQISGEPYSGLYTARVYRTLI